MEDWIGKTGGGRGGEGLLFKRKSHAQFVVKVFGLKVVQMQLKIVSITKVFWLQKLEHWKLLYILNIFRKCIYFIWIETEKLRNLYIWSF